jgi:uncharacterized membrane protein
MNTKILTIFLCVIGLSSVCYGMVKDNDILFIVGILFVIAGYIMIRKRLKAAMQNKDQ